MSIKYRYKFIIEYDGVFFSGWQWQANHQSVQGALAKAVYALTQEEIVFYGAGRTDRGVHALGQVAHADFSHSFSIDTLRKGMNFYLKDDAVRILEVQEVPASFDARFSATFRCYLYRILNRLSESVLTRKRCWWIPVSLCVEKMQEAASVFQGNHDFSHFRHRDCQATSAIKTLDRLDVRQEGHEIWITAQARSFLHRQVRMMVGALVHVGLNKWSAQHIQERLNGHALSPSPMTAPAWGLYLQSVGYGCNDQIVMR